MEEVAEVSKSVRKRVKEKETVSGKGRKPYNIERQKTNGEE